MYSFRGKAPLPATPPVESLRAMRRRYSVIIRSVRSVTWKAISHNSMEREPLVESRLPRKEMAPQIAHHWHHFDRPHLIDTSRPYFNRNFAAHNTSPFYTHLLNPLNSNINKQLLEDRTSQRCHAELRTQRRSELPEMPTP